ncbi:unnamed protein product [Haemonchus placei]|uniref:Ovule protein n=1 Tax=Haemonchus placei TaxID=6290 RepID=A0A0N4X0G3_HAEPC|nr:unnamed protein product [Haemonchus placei]
MSQAMHGNSETSHMGDQKEYDRGKKEMDLRGNKMKNKRLNTRKGENCASLINDSESGKKQLKHKHDISFGVVHDSSEIFK